MSLSLRRRLIIAALLVVLFTTAHLIGPMMLASSTVRVCREYPKWGLLCWSVPKE